MRNSFKVLSVSIIFAFGALPLAVSHAIPFGAAWADDDDGGGDNDDGGGSGNDNDDDGGGGGAQRGSGDGGGVQRSPRGGDGFLRLFQRPTQQVRPQRQRTAQPRRAAPPPPPPPDFAPNEIVALALTEADLNTLLAQGYDVIEEADVPGLTATPRRLRVPPGVSLADARGTIRALPSGTDADFNHFYRSEQGFTTDCAGSECPARLMIDWPVAPSRDASCGGSVPIGMIDTGINEEHETFKGSRMTVKRLSAETFDPSRAIHGTAVAALLVGDPATRSPGLVAGAPLVAVDAFYRAGGDERADVFTLVQALGYLVDEGVRVINLSLAGPDNSVLAETVDRLVVERDIVVVAAVGNSGQNADPEYPAAYDPVLAVTAVDRDGNAYRRAVRGAHVDLAAPGVNIWTAASISGARWKTGTSFAVPFVTAAAAILRESRPDLDALGVAEALRQRASDLGAPGPDMVFGAGLVNIRGLCDPSTRDG